MPKQAPKLVEDFLIPSLDSEKYGRVLYWLDSMNGIFRIKWQHKNSAQWSKEDAAVFTDWDISKKRFGTSDADYFMKAKQRFRAALYKLDTIERRQCKENGYKEFRITLYPQIITGAEAANSPPPVLNNVVNSDEEEKENISQLANNDARSSNNNIGGNDALRELSMLCEMTQAYMQPNPRPIQPQHNNMPQVDYPNQRAAANVGPEHHVQEFFAAAHSQQERAYPPQIFVQSYRQPIIRVLQEAPLMFVVPTYNDI